MPKTTYVWDELSDNVIEEYEDGVLSVSYTHEPGLYGNLLSQNRNGVTSYYHYDGRGDTVAITDDTGNVTDTKEYDAWGNVIASTGSTVTPYQFVGRQGYQTGSTGVYVRARIYQPLAARWFSVDPLILVPDDGPSIELLPYAYANNGPCDQIDPTGKFSVSQSGGGCSGPCGAFGIPWKFTFDKYDERFARKYCNADPITGKRPGYLVQLIRKEGVCNDDCCGSWRNPLTVPDYEEFWEAFYISDILEGSSPDDPQPNLRQRLGFSDYWNEPNKGASRGVIEVNSHVALFCLSGGKRPTGKLPGPGEGATNGDGFQTCNQAQIDGQPRNNPCQLGKSQCPAGPLPFTRSKPAFWSLAGLKQKKFKVRVEWDCCNGKTDSKIFHSGGSVNTISNLPRCR